VLDDDARGKVIHDNAARLYGLGPWESTSQQSAP
jgi:hypothetical protein